MKNAQVSVIIPTYRRPDFICDAINSVLCQTVNDIEIIVVDDNGISTEAQKRNEEILSKYIAENKIRYIVHETNKNGAFARNTGIFASNGEYIAFLDDDDVFHPNKLESQINKLKQTGADICLCGFTRVYAEKTIITIPELKDITIPNILMHRVDTCAGSCLLVKATLAKFIRGFDVSFERHQDLEFLIRLLKNGKMCLVEDSLVDIKMHTQNLKNPNLEKTIKQRLHFLQMFNKDIEDYSSTIAEDIHDAQYLEIVKVAIKNKRILTALYWLGKTYHPLKMTSQLLNSIIRFIGKRILR